MKYRVINYTNHNFQSEDFFTNQKKAIKFASEKFRDNSWKNHHIIILVEKCDKNNEEIWNRSNMNDTKCWGNC